MNLNEYNDEIMQGEKTILVLDLKLVDLKKQYDLQLLNELNALERIYTDTKDKNLSNIEKRTAEALKQEWFGKIIDEIKKLDYEIKVLEIENRHKLRTFNIMMKSELI